MHAGKDVERGVGKEVKCTVQNVAYNIDCMEYMKTLPDKAFDLAVVDPPYGDGNGGDGSKRFGGMFAASISGEATRTHTHTHSATVEQIRTTI